MTPLQQLVDCKTNTNKTETLIVIVGYQIHKLRKVIELYYANVPAISHKFVVICNNEVRTDELNCLLRDNALVNHVIFRDNSGWDIAMYAEAVLRFPQFSQYWFMNDDTETIANGDYLLEFEQKLFGNTGVIFVQLGCPRNFRTTYFGASRLFFLSWYVSIHYGVLRKNRLTVNRQNHLARVKNRVPGYVQAKEFELYNLTFAHVAGFAPQWLNNTEHFVDANAKKRRAFLQDPATKIDYSEPRAGLEGFAQYTIEQLWSKKVVTTDEIIDYASNNELISY